MDLLEGEGYIVKQVELGYEISYGKREMTTSPYSEDLRKKVIRYLKLGKSQR